MSDDNVVRNGLQPSQPGVAAVPTPSADEQAAGMAAAAKQVVISSTSPAPVEAGNGGTGVPDTGGLGVIFYSDAVYIKDPEFPRIDFVRKAGSSPPPPAVNDFRRQVNDVARVIRIIFQNDTARRDKFFGELRDVARYGVCSPYTNMDSGVANLAELKQYVADEFPTVRSYLWRWNVGLIGVAVFFAFLVMFASRISSNGAWLPAYATPVSQADSAYYAVLLLPLGVMLGIFAEFVFRVGDDMTYEQLANINPGRWKPLQRALNTLIIAVIFAAILAKGVFEVGVANTLLNDFWLKDPALAGAVGFVTGFAYPYVRDIVQQFKPVKRDAGP